MVDCGARSRPALDAATTRRSADYCPPSSRLFPVTGSTPHPPAESQAHRVPGRRMIGMLCCAAVLALLICTLWPFNPFPENRVRRVPGANGIAFDRAGVVWSKAPLRFQGMEDTESCTLELLLQPASVESVHTILGFYTPNGPRQFLVRQWTDGLLVSHALVGARSLTRATKFDVDHVFRPGKLFLLTIASGPKGTAVYLDGQAAQVFPRFRIPQNELAGEIVLGTSPTDYQPWPGQILGLAIYSRELAPADVFRHYKDWTSPGVPPPDLNGAVARYAFNEEGGREIHNEVAAEPDLEIPAKFSIPHKAILQSPGKEFSADWQYANDVLVNIAGFVPLGLLVYSYLAWSKNPPSALLCTVLAGGFLSLLIEVLQAYIPRRVSGMTDIITNTLGTAVGALIAQSNVTRSVLGRLRLIPPHDGSTR
jgi:VanZ family protein